MKEKERVVLVGVRTQQTENFDHSLEELASLTKTAGGAVVGTLVQNRPKIDPKTIVGKGKMQELKALCEANEADLVIFNQELSPRQSQLLDEGLQMPVIDRVQLILDIFALRAHSREGKLQVELAQTEYLLPRLAGQGKNLSRLGGGIGTRGPGESKLETDRRYLRERITTIKKELKQVEAHRQRTRQKRQVNKTFQIGLIGYTNAGKSTILNLLTAADTYEKDELFATLDPLTKKWRLSEGMELVMTDTVGFIQDLPTQLIHAFHATLEESQEMDLLLHVVDASSANRRQEEQTVLELMDDLDLNQIPILTVYNKVDKIDPDYFVPTLFPHVLIAATQASSEETLNQAIKEQLMEMFTPYERTIAENEGRLLDRLKKETLLVSVIYQENTETYLIKGFAPAGSTIWQDEK